MLKRLFLTLAGLLLTLIVVIGVFQADYFGKVLALRDSNPDTTAFMERVREQQGPVTFVWRDYAQISDNLKRAVLIAEDARFMEHFGFDWRGIRHAISRNEEAGEAVAGGSTVTQQLAKNLYLSSEKTYRRKLQEAVIALMMEVTLSKKRILELYLNTVQWGNRQFGAEAAARHYFGVDAASLSPSQAAQLAVLLPRPSYYDVHGTTDYVQQRTVWIEQQLPIVAIPAH